MYPTVGGPRHGQQHLLGGQQQRLPWSNPGGLVQEQQARHLVQPAQAQLFSWGQCSRAASIQHPCRLGLTGRRMSSVTADVQGRAALCAAVRLPTQTGVIIDTHSHASPSSTAGPQYLLHSHAGTLYTSIPTQSDHRCPPPYPQLSCSLMQLVGGWEAVTAASVTQGWCSQLVLAPQRWDGTQVSPKTTHRPVRLTAAQTSMRQSRGRTGGPPAQVSGADPYA